MNTNRPITEELLAAFDSYKPAQPVQPKPVSAAPTMEELLAAFDNYKPPQATAAQGAAALPKQEMPRWLGVLNDAGVSLSRGIAAVPGAAVGLADMVTGGRAGKALNERGIHFGRIDEEIAQDYTQGQKDANARVAEAEGAWNKVGAMVQNPSTIGHAVLQSAPQMLAGGAVGRGLSAVGKVAPWLAGAIGEGVVGAGSSATQIRESTDDGLLTPQQAALAGLTGAATAAISAGLGKVGAKVGLDDVDTLLAGGKLGNVPKGSGLPVMAKVAGGAASEGLEEYLQSFQESVNQNIALGRPIYEGAAEDAAMGAVTGAAMGGGTNLAGGIAAHQMRAEQARAEQAQTDSFAQQVLQEVKNAEQRRNAAQQNSRQPQMPTLAELQQQEYGATVEDDMRILQKQMQQKQGKAAQQMGEPVSVGGERYMMYVQKRRQLESGGNANAKASGSSATGIDQFTSGTFLHIVKRHMPHLAAGKSDAQILQMRLDPHISGQAAQALDRENANALQAAGVPVTEATLYAAHHFGASKAVAFGRAGMDTPMSSILTPAQMQANPYLNGKTKAQVLANWNKRAGLDGGAAVGVASSQQFAQQPAAMMDEGVSIRPAMADDPAQQNTALQDADTDWMDAVLQNRDRSTQGSIAQMQAISANPDYGRMGFSRDFANGAPVVAGNMHIPPVQMGRQDVAIAADGRRIPVQYAVVEAGQLHASNAVDGTQNAAYANKTHAGLRAIAGNGRIAGLQAAYAAGRANGYVQEMATDNLHGIDPQAVQGMQQPVLVRIMPTSEVTSNIGDISNTTGNLSMTAVEQANNDARRIDLGAIRFAEDGGLTADAVRQFVRGMPQAEQGGLIDTNGQPTRQAVDRANAAIFAKAYGNDGLARLYAQAQDPEARLIMSALAQAAPQMARLEGAGDLDIRELVAQAAEIAVNARREGKTIAQVAQQLDLTTDAGVFAVLDLFAANPRSSKPVAQALQNAAQFAYEEANKPATDMFGDVPRATRQDVLSKLKEDTYGNQRTGQEDLGQQAGRRPDAHDAARHEADTAGYTNTSAAQTDWQGRTDAGRADVEPAHSRSQGISDDGAEQEARASRDASQRGNSGDGETFASAVPKGLPAREDADSRRLVAAIRRDLQGRGNEAASLFDARTVQQGRLHDALAGALAAFERATGTRVVVFRNLTPEIEDFNGVNFRDGVVYINENSQHPLTLTATHEWLHNIKKTNPVMYRTLAEEVVRQGRLSEYRQHLKRVGEPRWENPNVVVEELTAAAVSDALTDPEFLHRLAQRNQGVFKKVAQKFLDFLNTLTGKWRDQGSNQYLRDVEAFRDRLAAVLDLYERGGDGNAHVTEAMFQRVWHGTPHRGIEQTGFRLDKIGTGEGAQAYGWGMYFASKREVAEGYRRDLADTITVNGLPLLQNNKRVGTTGDEIVDDLLVSHRGDVDAAIKEAKDSGVFDDIIPTLEQLRGKVEIDNKGQLYSADMPEDSGLLDWDRLMNKQPAKVKRRINKLIDAIPENSFPAMGMRNKAEFALEVSRTNGATFYNMLEDLLGSQQKASELLREHGIPGIRYLDGNSRDAGKGSHNYVIWDEALLTPDAAQIEPMYSRSAMKDVDANIRRGREALAKAITEKTTVHRAMHRVGMGWVDFVWGDDKRGLAHILKRRQVSDGMSEAQALRFLNDRVVQTIAQGKEARRSEFNQALRVQIAHDGAQVSLVQRPGSNTWVLTAFEMTPSPAGRGATPSAGTDIAPIRSRRNAEGVADIVHADRESSQEPRFSRQQPEEPFGGGTPWEVSQPTRVDNFTRNYINNKIDLKKTVDSAAATGKEIADEANPYLADELYIGRVDDGLEQLKERQLQPLIDAVAKSDVSVETLQRYLHANHAEERNVQMAKVNNEAFTLDYNMAGMSTREARQVLAELEASPQAAEIKRLANMVYAITRETRRRLVREGLATVDEINAWEGAYKNYVPLMRDVEETGGRAQGYNVKGNESRRAVGSQKEVRDILANVIAQAESSIIRAEKARVGRALLQFAKENPNPDFWQVNKAPTERVIDERTGLVVERVDPMYKNADTTLVVKVDGKEQFITFNEKNERAVALVRNLKNLDTAEIGPVVEMLGKVTRYVAMWTTSRNPLFWVTNFARDAQSVVFNLQDTQLKGKELSVFANMPKAFAAVSKAEFGNGGNAIMDRYYREFSENGGKTGYIKSYKDSVERMSDIMKEIEHAKQSAFDPRKVGRGLIDIIDGANDVVENGVRLSVYALARQNGISAQQAASIAKNITVNFNRRGNRTGILNSLYMFSNANIQGNMRMLAAIKKSRRAKVYAGLMMAAGHMMSMMNIFGGGDDDETRKKRYELVPEFERERSWIVLIPGSDRYVKIPLPQGPHTLFNVGRLMAEVQYLGYKPLDAASGLVSSFMGAFNPVGGGVPSWDMKGVAQVATPSAVRPFVDIAVNQNFAGTPIAREASPYASHKKPNAYNGRASTPEYWHDSAKLLNDWTGGDNVHAGAVNFAPETLAYLVKSYALPGIAQAADKAGRYATTGKEDITRIPGVDRFFGTIDEVARNRAAWDEQRKIAQTIGEVKQYMKEGRRDKAEALLEELGDGDARKGRRIMALNGHRDKQMRDLNKRKNAVQAISNPERRQQALERLQAVEAQMNARWLRAINGEEKSRDR